MKKFLAGTKRATPAARSFARLAGLGKENTFRALKRVIERNNDLTPDEKKVLKLKYGIDGIALGERGISDTLRIEYTKVISLLESATKKVLKQ